jgi:ATP-dependent Lon protease
VNRFREARSQFTLDEWTQLLITSAGYRPAAFTTFRKRLLVLSRLVPLVQKNVYLVEMGPRGTGKSYLLRNLSSRVYLLAGAKATPAMLIYDLRRREVGIVGRKKVVVFDEIGATSFPDRSLVASLKDYMESSIVGRGGRALVADCSFFLTGNLDLDPTGEGPDPSYPHYFHVFPPELCDTAIIDRIQGFIPGWELPKISDDVLADGVGLVTDYFGEVLGELRNDLTFLDRLQSDLKLGKDAKIRDKTSVLRIASGLLKMLFPNGKYERDEMNAVAQIAVELRQRVYHQLTKMSPGEFPLKFIHFAGMPRHNAKDLDAQASVISPHDDEVNQNSVVGKITLLTVFPKTGGGDVAFVECGHDHGSGLSITGLPGAVMQQSLKASYDCLLHLGASVGLPPAKLRAKKMSVHLVNVAEPKDGPSAGLAFTLAMLSAATHRPVRRQLAVTGEISLMGNVGRIGGLAEKLEAAKRHGRKVVIIPAANAPELQALRHITDACLEVVPVSNLAEAVRVAFER